MTVNESVIGSQLSVLVKGPLLPAMAAGKP